MTRRRLLSLLPLSLLSLPAFAQSFSPPSLPREFRGVWVATVANIDWPSKPGLPAETQKKELLAILNRAHNLNLNAVILQVRPMCDALYASRLEPWSSFLTGTMGVSPGYDPLAFAVTEAHRRGIELHAWVNPYRARPAGMSVTPSADHVINARPDLAKKYGGSYWCDPGEPEVQQKSLAVILDIVKRYDVDGIHIDDYFYPYAEKNGAGNKIDFPDGPSWQNYVRTGGPLGRDDWRRDNVNQFVQKVYSSIKQTKPWVKFGISPFGIYRPGYPAQIKGSDMYDQLYADSRKWLVEGWCDYFAPQLYWSVEAPAQSFPVLLSWWTQQNPQRRHLWPGLFTSRVPDQWNVDEIEWQTKIARGFADVNGTIHFSMKTLMSGSLKDDGDSMAGRLKEFVYQEKALVPASPWLSAGVPDPPVNVKLTGGVASWYLTPGSAPRFWAVRYLVDKDWKLVILPGGKLSHNAPRGAKAVSVNAIDKAGDGSEPVVAQAR